MLNSASTPNLKETFCCAAEVGGEMAPSGLTGKSACLLRLKMGGSEKSGWAVQENKDELFRKINFFPNASKMLVNISFLCLLLLNSQAFTHDVWRMYHKEYMRRSI